MFSLRSNSIWTRNFVSDILPPAWQCDVFAVQTHIPLAVSCVIRRVVRRIVNIISRCEKVVQLRFATRKRRLVYAALIASMAHSYIGIVTAEQYLAALGDDVAIFVDTCVNGCFFTASADRLYLGY